MRRAVDRRAAASRCRRRPGSSGASGRVSPLSVLRNRSAHRPRHRSSRARAAEIDAAGALRPARLPVDALTLTASGSSAEERRDRRRASRRGAAPRRGRAPTIVRSTPAGRQPAVGEARHDLGEQLARCRCRAASMAPPGNSRPRSPRPAAPGARRRRRGATTSPSEWPWRRGAPAISMPPRRSGVAGPERMAVVADAGPSGRGRVRASRPATRSRSAGTVTLRLVGLAGHDMDRRFSRPPAARPRRSTSRPSPRRRERRRAAAAARALRRLRRAEPARSTVSSTRSPCDPLERVGDRHHRDGRAVPRPPRDHGLDERGRDQRSAPSWTRTTRSPSGSGRTRSSASKPARRSPGAAHRRRTTRASAAQPAPAPRARPRSVGVTTTIDADSRPPRAAVDRPREQRPAGRCASSLSVPPMRGSRRRPATTIGVGARPPVAVPGRRSVAQPGAAARRPSGRRRSGGRA